jgi:apolipoprotein N-acyltransferase
LYKRSGRPPEPVSLETGRGGTISIAALVCIDSSHPELARSVRRAGARLIVSIANEASTGAWSAALHARAARLRAIENRVPVVRVANTGPTLWIDEHGRVAAGLAAGTAGSGSHALALAGRPPPHVYLGDGAIALAGLLSVLVIGTARLFQR